MDKKMIYFDHAATTPTRPEVLDEMLPYFTAKYGNPSSIYGLGQENKKALEDARDKVASAIGAKSGEIVFTSSGTESDNWALKGIVYHNSGKGKHIITSSIEHHAIMNTCEYLEMNGFEVTYVSVDEFGMIDPLDIKKAIRKDTILISIMFANNEIGTIQPIREIGKIARESGIYFHTDAVQAVGNIHINVEKMNIDALSLSAHKFYGPKGVGALYIKKGTKINSFIHGGGQEGGRRAGTENIPAIVGLGKAIEIAQQKIDMNNDKMIRLRERAIDEILRKVSYSRINGHRINRLAGNINFSFDFIDSESLIEMLDRKGIQASTGSACNSGSLNPSHVLLALGVPHEIAHGSLRITFGDENTNEDVDYLIKVIPPIIEHIRERSLLYQNIKNNYNKG